MDRREFLRAAGTTTGSLLLAGQTTADHEEATYPQPVDGTEVYQPKIRMLKYPLSGVPAILETNDTLRVELDAEDPSGVEATLVPSFGETETEIELDLVSAPERRDSTIWTDEAADPETFAVAEFDLPPVNSGDGTEDLYDLHVSWDGGEDSQPRAVSLYTSFPEEPTIAVIADPQIADPRALQAGAEESGNKGTPEPLVTRMQRTVGDGSEDSRWNATQTAIQEINLLDPDLVLVAGDLTFGQDAPGKYYLEYEEAWRVFNRIQAPTYTVLGNHDGYIQGGVDGKALYRETFGPYYYSVDVGDALHITALDTYDWNSLDRLSGSFTVSSYGGQVRDAQYEWLKADLEPYVEGEERGSVLALGHHNPSWQWDGDQPLAEGTHGTPGAEQAGRGTRFFTTGQAWTGQAHHFDIRQLFEDAGVSAFFSGHSHRDRISRTVDSGGEYLDVVETPGPHTANDGEYHYIEYEDSDGDGRPEGKRNDGDRTQEDLAALIDDGDGTLYVNCTTSASSTGQYWGWRPLSMRTSSGEVTINDDEFGYAATAEFLEDRAVYPDSWNPDHSEVGLYSHPSYLLEVERQAETGDSAAVEITNGLANPFSGAVVLSIDECEGVAVSGGKREWTRSDGETTDVKVSFDVPSGGSRTITVECRPR